MANKIYRRFGHLSSYTAPAPIGVDSHISNQVRAPRFHNKWYQADIADNAVILFPDKSGHG